MCIMYVNVYVDSQAVFIVSKGMYASIYICIHICKCIYIYIFIYVSMYIYVYLYTITKLDSVMYFSVHLYI